MQKWKKKAEDRVTREDYEKEMEKHYEGRGEFQTMDSALYNKYLLERASSKILSVQDTRSLIKKILRGAEIEYKAKKV